MITDGHAAKSPVMHVDVIDTYAGFEALRLNWERLYDADSEAQFFLSWIWLSRVFRQHPVEWRVLAVKPDKCQPDYVAFLPLRLKTRWSTSQKAFRNELRMAGTLFWADYTGLVCHPDYDEEAIPCLAGQLKRMHWRDLYLKNIRISDRRLDLLTRPFHKSIFKHEFLERTSSTDGVDRLVCPYVDLPGDFDTYLTERLSANTRQKVRRFLRKVENSNDLRITHATPHTLQRDLDVLVGYWKKKWLTRKGAEAERLARKYREILQCSFESGVLFMPLLWQGDTPLGALGSFIDQRKKTLLFFVAGRDESCTNPPPGLILHAHSIRWAIENGLESYEFLRGNEHYKYSFGARERHIRYLVVSTRSGTNLNRTLDPKCVDDLLEESIRLEKTGQSRQAEVGLRQILETRPGHAEALRHFGRLLYRAGDFAEAQSINARLVAIDPANMGAWQRLGKAHLALHEFEKAEDAFRKSIALSADQNVSDYYFLGCALQGRDLSQEAVIEFEHALDIDARNSSEKRKQHEIRTQFL